MDYSALALNLGGEVTTAITAALTVGVVVLAVRIGWSMFKAFTR